MLEGIVGIENQRGFSVDEGATGDDGNDFVFGRGRLIGPFEDGSNDGSLPPGGSFDRGLSLGRPSFVALWRPLSRDALLKRPL